MIDRTPVCNLRKNQITTTPESGSFTIFGNLYEQPIKNIIEDLQLKNTPQPLTRGVKLFKKLELVNFTGNFNQYASPSREEEREGVYNNLIRVFSLHHHHATSKYNKWRYWFTFIPTINNFRLNEFQILPYSKYSLKLV